MTPATEEGARRYPGWKSFDDSELSRRTFFGRDDESRDLFHRVLADDLVVVHGRSGCGKSSLIEAGLLHPLRTDGYFPVTARVNDRKLGSLGSIFAAVRKAGESLPSSEFEYVHGVEDSLWHFFKTVEIWHGDSLLKPVLILDQFEELFTMQRPESREELIRDLGHLVRGVPPQDWEKVEVPRPISANPPRVKIILSLRADHLADLEHLAGSLPGVLRSRFPVRPLTAEQAEEAISRPASAEGEGFESGTFTWSEEALKSLLDFLVVGNEVEPFQLQMLCRHFEQKEIIEGGKQVIAEVGDSTKLEGILQGFYDTEVAAVAKERASWMPWSWRWSRRRMLRKVCERVLISDRRRRLSFEQEYLKSRTKVLGVPALVDEDLISLRERRVLQRDGRTGGMYYELTHDTLVEPILKLKERREMRARVRGGVAILLVAVSALLMTAGSLHDQRLVNVARDALYAEGDPTTAALLLGAVDDYDDAEWAQLVSAALAQPLPEAVMLAHSGGIRDSDLAADGSFFVSASEDGTVVEWPLTAGAGSTPIPFDGHGESAVRVVEIAPTGGLVASGAADGSVWVWTPVGDGSDGRDAGQVLSEEAPMIRDLAFSPDGEWLAIAAGDDTLRVHNTRDDDASLALSLGAGSRLERVAFHGQEDRLATADRSGEVRLWDLTADVRLAESSSATNPNGRVATIEFGSSTTQPLVVARSGGAVLLGVDTPGLKAPGDHVGAEPAPASAAAMSADGEHVLTMTDAGDISLLYIEGGAAREEVRFEHRGRGEPTVLMDAIPDDPSSDDGASFFAVTAWSDGSVRVWHKSTLVGEPMFLELRHPGISAAAFSSSADRLFTSSRDGTNRDWRLERWVDETEGLRTMNPLFDLCDEGRCIERAPPDLDGCPAPQENPVGVDPDLPAWPKVACDFALIPMGNSASLEVVLWQSGSAGERGVVGRSVNDASFNDDGGRVVIGTWGGVTVLDLPGANPVTLPSAQPGQVSSVAFSAEDRVLAATTYGFQLWDDVRGSYPADRTVFVPSDLDIQSAAYSTVDDVILYTTDDDWLYPASRQSLKNKLTELTSGLPARCVTEAVGRILDTERTIRDRLRRCADLQSGG